MPIIESAEQLLTDALPYLRSRRDESRVDALCYAIETYLRNREDDREKAIVAVNEWLSCNYENYVLYDCLVDLIVDGKCPCLSVNWEGVE